MKSTKIFLLITIGLLFFKQSAHAQLNYYPSDKDFDSAVRAAKALKKYLFIEFYTDWCVNCKKMEAQVFTDYDLTKYINANYVPVKLNAEFFNVMDICEKYGIHSYPTILILDPNNNKVLNKLVGYYGVLPLTAEVKNTVSLNKRK